MPRAMPARSLATIAPTRVAELGSTGAPDGTGWFQTESGANSCVAARADGARTAKATNVATKAASRRGTRSGSAPLVRQMTRGGRASYTRPPRGHLPLLSAGGVDPPDRAVRHLVAALDPHAHGGRHAPARAAAE